MRPCVLTMLLVVVANVLYRTLLLLEGQGVLAKHGFNITLPRLTFSRKAVLATVPVHFLVAESDYCRRRPELLGMAVVTSRVENTALRDETRQTWGAALEVGVPLGRVFLLGRPANREQRLRVRQESRAYRDIVQGDYEDGDSVAKALNGVLWLMQQCAQVPFTVHASDKVLLDVFLLHNFLWEVLRLPERQAMVFGHVTTYSPPAPETPAWSLGSLRHLVPEVTETPLQMYTEYLEEGAWFGRTEALGRLLGASGAVPLVSPTSLYFTGMLLDAAGLYRSPDVFNMWWGTDSQVQPEDLGFLLGWLNETLVPPRRVVWKQLRQHYKDQGISPPMERYDNNTLKEVTSNTTTKAPKKVSPSVNNSSLNASFSIPVKRFNRNESRPPRESLRMPMNNRTLSLSEHSMNNKVNLFRKKQLEKMIKTVGGPRRIVKINKGKKM